MGYAANFGTNAASTIANYTTDKYYSEIRSFYLKEAGRIGWVLIGEETFEGAFYYKPGEKMIFQKGDYKMEIVYYLKKTTTGNLSLRLSWNL